MFKFPLRRSRWGAEGDAGSWGAGVPPAVPPLHGKTGHPNLFCLQLHPKFALNHCFHRREASWNISAVARLGIVLAGKVMWKDPKSVEVIKQSFCCYGLWGLLLFTPWTTFGFIFFFSPQVSVRGIFLNFIRRELIQAHKNPPKKRKNPYGIFIANYFPDSSFLQLTSFMGASALPILHSSKLCK